MSETSAQPVDAYREQVSTVISWQDIRGASSVWELIRLEVSKLDGVTLVGCASHWNALIVGMGGGQDDKAALAIAKYLASTEQLQELNEAAVRKRRKEGWPASHLPPVVNRQQLLILIRLAFQYARWDGSGAKVSGPQVLSLLLRINDHLDGLPRLPPKLRRRRTSTLFDRFQAFPLMFSLHDFSHRKFVENGVTRTLRLIREVHQDLLNGPQKKQALDLPQLFRDATGLSLETYLTLCFAAVSLTTPPGTRGSPHPGSASAEDTGVFNIAPSSLRGDSQVSEEEATRLLGLVALTPQEFKERLDQANQLPFQTNLTVFRSYPVVRFESGLHRVLDKAFLLDKLGSGAYWVLRDSLQAKEEYGGDARKAAKRLNGWWGELIEEYLHRAFRNSPASSRYLAEPTFDGSTDEGGDGLLDYGDTIVLMEYKSSPLAVVPRHSVSPHALAREILAKFAAKKGSGTGERRGARGIPQLAGRVRAFLAGRPIGGVASARVLSIYPVLVCSDTALGAPMVNCLLRRAFDRELAGIDRTRVRPLSVLTVEDVEMMLGREGDVGFPAMLRSWHDADPKMTTYPALMIRGRYFSDGDHENPWVREASESWKNEMLRRLWPARHAAATGADRQTLDDPNSSGSPGKTN